MNKKAPSVLQLFTIAAFALSCFGLLLFLWITFGGPTPLKAGPYTVKVPFYEATQVASQSDVRISGVSVGKVSKIELSPDGKQAMAVIDVEPKFAPLPADTRATLRAKTLLGETYVELTPGSRNAQTIEDGGVLPRGQVSDPVQLDEILRAFDSETRAAWRTWMQDSAIAIRGQGQAFSNVFAELQPTFSEFDRLFRVLDTQERAVRQFFRNGSVAFDALRGRNGQLQSLIRNANQVFQTTAQRDRDIEATFVAFPTFLDESKLTLERLETFARDTDPLMRQLIPVAEELSPFLISAGRLAPEARGFFKGLAPVIAGAPRAFPALQRLFRNRFPPLLRAVQPFLRNLTPLIEGVDFYRRELTALMGNGTAALNAFRPNEPKYLRALSPLNPQSLASFPDRLLTNRNNAYTQPGSFGRLRQGLPNFHTYQCSSGIQALLDPDTPNDPDFNQRVEGDLEEAQEFFDRLKLFAFGDQLDSNQVPAPGCGGQEDFEPLGADGAARDYLQTLESPAP